MPEKVKTAAAMFPESRIDILVNSAGVVSHSDFLDMSEQEYDSIMDINAKGTFFMSQAVAKYMIENRIKGHILNVTSSSALRPATLKRNLALLNARPRKVLNFRSPADLWNLEISNCCS